MITAKHSLHWMRFPTPVRDVDAVCEVMGGEFGPVEHRGGFNHPMRFVHDTGAAVYFGSRVEEQPIVVDVPGEACEQLSVEQLCDWADGVGGLPSRVDVAADVDPPEEARGRLLQMRRTFKRGGCNTMIPRESCQLVQNDDPAEGWTLYVGKRSSEVFIRAYDRRGPLRVEPEWKPAKGTRAAVVPMLRQYGVAGVWRMLAGHCVWPMAWYQELLSGDAPTCCGAPEKPADLSQTIDALREQFGPTFFALGLLGVRLSQLAVMPERPNAQQVRRFAAYARQARELGYDPSKLEQEVKRWRRSK